MMDEQVLDAICEKLIPCLYDEVLYLCFAVHKPIFLPSLNSSLIGPGDLCGEELLTWALDPCSSVPPFQHARLLPSLKLKPLLSFPRT
ncbi:hypothetical protein Peur_045001 [Populus x canadensis]